MQALTMCLAYDAPGKHDASSVFIPGALGFSHIHGLDAPVRVDNHAALAHRFVPTLDTISALTKPIDTFAYFGHGWRTGCALGVSLANLDTFCRVLSQHSAPALTVCLYACSTGEADDEAGGRTPDRTDVPGAGDGSLADRMRDLLCGHGVKATVYAHAEVGHAFRCKFVRRFGPETTDGGSYVVAPDAPEWHAWCHAIDTTDLWARFPFMTRDELLAELSLTLVQT